MALLHHSSIQSVVSDNGGAMLITLLSALVLAGVICAARLLQAAVARAEWPRVEATVLGAVTNFFDTLGIGSFAPTMAWLKLRGLVPDRLIPCTMLVGHTLPSVTQALYFPGAARRLG